MKSRSAYAEQIRMGLKGNSVVSLLGPRQVGKTTLARMIAEEHKPAHFFDLEDPVDVSRLREPLTALEPLRGLIVIDEIQRQPDLFLLIRVLADRRPLPARFLLLGSTAPELVRGVSESLAGRTTFVDLHGFDLSEVGPAEWRALWWRGGYPPASMADSDAAARAWLEALMRTLLERDLPQAGITVPAATLRRFWTMTAHYHAQTWNSAELARSLGSSEATARRYLDHLTSLFLLRQLPPWFENVGKRQVKAPKIYVRDAGLLHALLDVPTAAALTGHPKLGASWEGFVLEQAAATLGDRNLYYWATHGGAELDIFTQVNGQRLGIEIKHADAPTLSKSMHIARADLKLDRLLVVTPGTRSWPLADWAEVVAIAEFPGRLARVQGRSEADLAGSEGR